jgi:dGTPase
MSPRARKSGEKRGSQGRSGSELASLAAGPAQDEAEHERLLEERISELLSNSRELRFFDCLRELGGADPREVFDILAKLLPDRAKLRRSRQDKTPGVPGTTWPVPDPARGQWWFTPRSILWLTTLIRSINRSAADPGVGKFHVACLGTPTVARAIANDPLRVCLLDADDAVIASAARLAPSLNARTYDVIAALPEDLRGSAPVVVLDPPWYDPLIKGFLRRAMEICMVDGHLIMTLPSQFTRPGVEAEKMAVLDTLTSAGLQVQLYDPGRLEFVVPRFEQCAFDDLPDFDGVPWRRADVVHLRMPRQAKSIPEFDVQGLAGTVRSFSRDSRVFRVFVAIGDKATQEKEKRPLFTPTKEYRRNVSRRKIVPSEVNVWTSERRGGRTTDVGAATLVLKIWSKGDKNAQKVAIAALTKSGVDEMAARSFVEHLDAELELFSRFGFERVHRDDEEIHDYKLLGISSLGIRKASPREHGSPSDTFRAEFQRDRDRILWSKSLRKLTNKTQLYPVERSDQLRQRLTHSLEVMQLATTIGDAFGLNRDLIEAGALAHDVGHTPFGHAGEFALDVLLRRLSGGMGGFNHYEHGVDVVRYLEDAYHAHIGPTSFGLDLTPEVCECILKHTFCHVDLKAEADRESVWANSKHRKFLQKGNCHLEGQAIRIADKISYLISDLEDGILLGAIERHHLLSCRLFHYASIEFADQGGDLHAEYIVQRRNILQVLMEDVILASEARVARLPDAAAARKAETFTIDHSDEMRDAVGQVWRVLQVGRLHRDARVHMANMRAARIVTELTVLFALFPNLIEERFASAYSRLFGSDYIAIYKKRAGIKIAIQPPLTEFVPIESLIGDVSAHAGREVLTEHVIQAKDYVAALTDAEAKHLHWKYIASYSDRT